MSLQPLNEMAKSQLAQALEFAAHAYIQEHLAAVAAGRPLEAQKYQEHAIQSYRMALFVLNTHPVLLDMATQVDVPAYISQQIALRHQPQSK